MATLNNCLDQTLIDFGKSALSKEVSKLAMGEVYGLGDCARGWNVAFSKYLIVNMIEVTGAENLSCDDAKCLEGDLLKDALSTCCSQCF